MPIFSPAALFTDFEINLHPFRFDPPLLKQRKIVHWQGAPLLKLRKKSDLAGGAPANRPVSASLGGAASESGEAARATRGAKAARAAGKGGLAGEGLRDIPDAHAGQAVFSDESGPLAPALLVFKPYDVRAAALVSVLKERRPRLLVEDCAGAVL